MENDVRRSLYIQENDSEATDEQSSSEASNSHEGLDSLQKELGLVKQTDKIREKRLSKRYSANLEAQMDQRPITHIETLSGRPDLTSIVKEVVKAAEQRDTVAVGGNLTTNYPLILRHTNWINSLWPNRTYACCEERGGR